MTIKNEYEYNGDDYIDDNDNIDDVNDDDDNDDGPHRQEEEGEDGLAPASLVLLRVRRTLHPTSAKLDSFRAKRKLKSCFQNLKQSCSCKSL